MQDINSINPQTNIIIFMLFILLGITKSFAQNGALDFSFGTDGLATTDIAEDGENCGDAVVDNLGNITIAGSAYSGGYRKAMVQRLNREGIADSSFNEIGYKIYTSVADVTESNFYAIDLQDDKKIVSGGYARYSDAIYGVIYRIDSNGQLDNTFGENGVAKLFSGHYSTGAVITDIVVQPDGKILFCGTENSVNTSNLDQFITGRCLPDGTPDSTFGGNGFVYCYFEGSPSEATSMVLQSDGKIVVGGTTNDNFAIIRYLANGAPDPTFGNWGEVIISVTDEEHLNKIGILSDGKIIAVGYIDMHTVDCYGATKILIACFNPDGTLFYGFSSGGKAIFTFDNCNNEAYCILVQPDDRIIIGGASGNSSILESSNYIFLRLLPNGSRDSIFGLDGLLETEMYEATEFYSYPKALLFQPSGKAVLVGHTNDENTGNTFFSTMRITTGVDSSDLVESNPPIIQEIEYTQPTWFYNNILYVNNSSSDPLSLAIFAISGVQVISLVAPVGLTEYNLQDLPKGIYFVASNKNESIPTKKIIVSYAGN